MGLSFKIEGGESQNSPSFWTTTTERQADCYKKQSIDEPTTTLD
jgi:hypothetical protein